MIYSSGIRRDTGPPRWKVQQASGKWSGRTTLLFVVVASLVCWGLLIGKAVLIL